MAQIISALITNQFCEHSGSWSPDFCACIDTKAKRFVVRIKLPPTEESNNINESEKCVHKWLRGVLPLIAGDLLITFLCTDITLLPQVDAVYEWTFSQPNHIWLTNFHFMTTPSVDMSIFIQSAIDIASQSSPDQKSFQLHHASGVKVVKATTTPPLLLSVDKSIEFGNIFVGKSNIVHGGLGLFASKPIPRGATIAQFTGKKYTLADFTRLNPENSIACEYSITGETHDGKQFVFDPTENEAFNIKIARRTSNYAPFINEPPEGVLANAESVSVSSETRELRLDIIATRHIKEQEEIYMCYNRVPSKLYKIGFAQCLALNASVVEPSAFSGWTWFCMGMTPTHNLDHHRVKALRKLGHKVVTFSRFGATTSSVVDDYDMTNLCKHILLPAEMSEVENILLAELAKHGRVCLYVDYIHHGHSLLRSSLPRLIQAGFTKIILPSFVKERLALNKKDHLSLLRDNGDILPWPKKSCIYWSSLLNTQYPLIIIIKKDAKIPLVRQVFSAQQIAEDVHMSDEDTVRWLDRYSNCAEKLNINTIPFFKQETKNRS